jgi:AAA+ ATPase superfamily predicted ATPase
MNSSKDDLYFSIRSAQACLNDYPYGSFNKGEYAMNQAFVGRQKELQSLENAFLSDRSEFYPIYGRRRVGKSELILHFGGNKPFIYYLGKKAPEALQIREFLQECARTFKEPLIATMSCDGWKTALDTVVARWKGKRKLILAFDEYQWISEASPSLPSIIQELWDRQWRKQGNVFLILCGSYMRFMEREVLGNKSPLFGRRTGQIFLKPFNYKEAALFHPRYSIVDKARAYFFCGGIPLYLKFFSDKQSIEINIMNNFLNEYAPLFREPTFLLGEELRELDNYYGILLSLASGSSTGAQISQKSGVPERSLHYYLNHLENLGYLTRRYPLLGEKPSAKQVRYCISDPLLRFWFRFIYPSESSIVRMGATLALQECIVPQVDSYYGFCFEHLCREGLSEIYGRENVPPKYETGEYWDSKTQIDIVGRRSDGWTDLGECKWGTIRSPSALEQELLVKVKNYPNPRNATIGKLLFTRSPIAKKAMRGDFKYYSLEDLY